VKKNLKSLLATENLQLRKLNDIVVQSIEEEKLISKKLIEFEDKAPSLKSRLADKVAGFGGSWAFIGVFLAIMLIWMAVNLYMLRSPFDAYPFILLNLLLSTIAALQAPIIMMSQNRKEEKDRERAVNDYLVNVKAEIEVRNLHQKLDLLISEQMKTMFEIQKLQMEVLEEIKLEISTKQIR
jgi:uncharacterized membrane protein